MLVHHIACFRQHYFLFALVNEQLPKYAQEQPKEESGHNGVHIRVALAHLARGPNSGRFFEDEIFPEYVLTGRVFVLGQLLFKRGTNLFQGGAFFQLNFHCSQEKLSLIYCEILEPASRSGQTKAHCNHFVPDC